jgi:hypothetical protein
MVCCLNWHAYSEYGQQTGSRTRCSLPGVSGKTAPQKGIRVGALDNVVKLWLRGALECGFRNLSGGPRFGPASNADAYPRLTSGGGSAMRCAGPSKPQPLIGPSASASVVRPSRRRFIPGPGSGRTSPTASPTASLRFGRSSGAGGLVRRPALLHSCSRATRRR